MKGKKETQTNQLVQFVVEGILKKNGKEVIVLNLSGIENSICSRFVIAHGDSNSQVSAIAESVVDVVRIEKKEKPFHTDGMTHANWVLLDYGDVIVHIFQEPVRRLYNLEDLWADAKFEKIEDVN